ncbi:hypothetical protein AU186_03610 [Mycobacterium sp. GA-1999]|nr:hypothetical protein AU185_04625 [Mycobacterium sp. GA-0227b]KUH87780.1 hypothetical protein AU186_03610 [Mycobacterium sp. GA-1999]KUH88672.1 hypothetical protein AU187_06960 [Mycobacterium sp. IS-1556]
MLDAESVAGHLLKSDSMFAFLATRRSQLFPEEMFADLFPSRRCRPSVPAEVMTSVITLQALHGLSDNETVDAVTFDLRWKAACGLPITAPAFHSTTLTYWRRRLAAPERVISTVDPEARHAHKTVHRRQDGFKAHIAANPIPESSPTAP